MDELLKLLEEFKKVKENHDPTILLEWMQEDVDHMMAAVMFLVVEMLSSMKLV